MTASLRILVVDDNLIARIGVTTLLEAQPDMTVVGEAEGGTEAIAAYRKLRPDVVVCDLRMPVLDGASTTALLVKETPPARVLVLSHFEGDEDVFRAFDAGALGYVTKDVRAPELTSALRAVAAGERYVPDTLRARLERRQSSEALNARERQILRLVFEGRSNPEIARTLGLAKKTVEMYVTSVLFKLGASTRTEAVRVALERGWLSPD